MDSYKKMNYGENLAKIRWATKPMRKKGFTMIEMLLVITLIGALTFMFYPRVMNTQEKRILENTARDILTTLQQAKFQAVRTKVNHRVTFANQTGVWRFTIEKENIEDEWNPLPGRIRKTISPKFNVQINLPNQTVIFSPLGLISNFSCDQNSITIQSQKLKSYSHDDQRTINVFAGGSIAYVKSQS